MPAEVPLTPRAAQRLARGSALQAFDPAALALNEDWATHLDGKQVQRWAEALGRKITDQELAGHSDIRTTRRYYVQVEPELLQRACRVLETALDEAAETEDGSE